MLVMKRKINVFFYTLLLNKSLPCHQDYCLCTRRITNNHYICNTRTMDVFSVGNCCIWRWEPVTPARQCVKCRKVCKTKKKLFLCTQCYSLRDGKFCPRNIKGGRYKFRFGKHDGKTFYWVYKNDKRYAYWAFNKHNGKYGKWLRKTFKTVYENYGKKTKSSLGSTREEHMNTCKKQILVTVPGF